MLDRFGFRVLGRRVYGLDYRYEQALFRFLVQQEILNQIEADTANIVELGSGTSSNLLKIWLNGGPQDATYVGLEFTQAGRACAEYFAALVPQVLFRSFPFDYHAPEFNGFDIYRKTFVLTSYSIEQVPEIGKAIFDKLLHIPGLYKVLHIEPVGWQGPRPDDPVEAEIMSEMELSAKELRYNQNLISTLECLQSEGRIVIEQRKYNYLAHRPNLPGSVIVWRPKNHPLAGI